MGWLNRRKKRMTPQKMRRLMNWYGPYLGAGVKVDHIASDWHSLQVSMRMRWYNANAVGTHFGGSLYAMVDPHHMLLLMQLLGRDYVVWDKAAEIDFIKPGRGRLTAQVAISEQELVTIKQATSGGEKYLPQYPVEIKDQNNEVVARAVKTLYIRQKAKS